MVPVGQRDDAFFVVLAVVCAVGVLDDESLADAIWVLASLVWEWYQ